MGEMKSVSSRMESGSLDNLVWWGCVCPHSQVYPGGYSVRGS